MFENLSDQMAMFSRLPKDQEIELTKTINKMLSEAKSKAKEHKCFLCKKEAGFCNSHTVPKFSLKNISNNGMVFFSNTFIECPVAKERAGVNQAGTFHLICRECDSKVFQEYENPDEYANASISSKMLAEIALKNYLKLLDKRMIERSIYDLMIAKFPFLQAELLHKKEVATLDYKNYLAGYNKAKKLVPKDDNSGYYLFYYKLLNYTTPIAFQAAITLAVDFDGETINQIYNFNPNYKPNELQIAILPMEGKTAIMMFIDDGVKKYRKFIKQFNKLLDDEKLALINYLVFLYSEDYFISKSIESKVDLSVFKHIAGQTPTYNTLFTPNVKEELKATFRLDKYKSIPNLLDKIYAIE